MRFTVERNWIDVLGQIWQPGYVCGQRIHLNGAEVEELLEDLEDCGSCGGYHRVNFEGDCREDSERFPEPRGATRASVRRWLQANAGDFSQITDFHAIIGETEIPWETEEGEAAYQDCVSWPQSI